MSRPSAEERGLIGLMCLIVETLRRRGSMVKEQELFNVLRSVRPDLSFSEFNKALMTLEVRGVIEVDTARRSTRVIRLVEERT